MFKSMKKITDKEFKKITSNIILGLFLFSIADVLFYNGVLMLVVFMFYGVILATQKVDSKC